MKMKYLPLFLASAFVFASCDSASDKAKKNRFKKSPEALQSVMEPKAAEDYIRNYFTRLPKPLPNSIWLRNDYSPSENLELNTDAIRTYKSYDVGEEPKEGLFITSTPVVAEGKIYTISGKGEIYARSLDNPGQVIWRSIVESEYLSENREHGFSRKITGIFYESDSFLGGNIAYSLGKLFVSTKRGNLYALDAKTGKREWLRRIGVPIRSTPVAQDDLVLITTINNKTYAMDVLSGKTKWSHEGLEEKSKIFASPSPVIKNGITYIPYSSGEIYALELKTGIEKWSTITSTQEVSLINSSLNDISHTPLIHKESLIVVTSDGRLVMLNRKTGDQIWELSNQAISSAPWAAGNMIFVNTLFGELLAVAIRSGEIVWKANLEDMEVIDDNNLVFTNPVVADNKIFVADNEGTLRSYSPKNGKMLKLYVAPDNVYIKPIVADGKILMISNEADLSVYK
jgi:outer membrane protein assembly factor BamB